jgi:hypothetical protein
VKVIATAVAVIGLTAGSVAWSAAPQQAPAAQSKTEPGAAWPTMRHDLRNTGASDLRGLDPGRSPGRSRRERASSPRRSSPPTARSTSARPTTTSTGCPSRGEEVWRFETGEIIDTAPALLDDDTLIIGSGDENMYKVSTDPAIPSHQRVVWTFSPHCPPSRVSW